MTIKPLTILTQTASDPGFAVNSHLLMSENDAILVDAQFSTDASFK